MKSYVFESSLVYGPVLPDRKSVADRGPVNTYRNSLDVPERKEELIEMAEWFDTSAHPRAVRQWAIMTVRISHARDTYAECVESNPLIRGGVPVVRGTRMPVGMILANVATNMTLAEIAEDFGLNPATLVSIFQSLAAAFDRPLHEYHSARRVHEFQEANPLLHSGGEDCPFGISASPGG